jgi:A/G-specific adenine glycosylase
MWEFPNGRVERDPAGELPQVIYAAYKLKVHIGKSRKGGLGVINHAYTHFKITVHAIYCETSLIPQNKSLKWVRVTELEQYPMGKVDRQIARLLG